MNKKSVIMLLAKYPATYGHTTVIDNLTLELKKLNYDVAIGAFDFSRNPPGGIKKIVLNKTKLMIHGTNYLNFDVIHFHQTQLMYYLLNKKPTKPVIFHYHGASNFIQRQNFKFAMKLYKNKISKIISVSKAGITQMKNLVSNLDSDILYNGVDNDFFNKSNFINQKIGSPQLLFVGALRKYKKTKVLLDAMKEIIKFYPNSNLQIVGNGEEFFNLKSQIRILKLEKYVSLIGELNRNELKNYYNSCDVYISASTFEVCPVPPIEAMSCAKPLLLYNIEPHHELLENSNAGILFDDLTSKEILSKLKILLKEKDRFSQNAKNYAIKNDWSELSKQLISIYEKYSD